MRASTRLAAGLFGLATAFASCAAQAQARPDNITLLPAEPAAGDLVVLRHEIPACADQRIMVDPLGPMALRITLLTGDTCDRQLPARVETRELGRFAAGVVEISYVECEGLPPPPLPACTQRGTELLLVGGALPRPVSAWSTRAGALLALSLTLIGFGRMRLGRS